MKPEAFDKHNAEVIQKMAQDAAFRNLSQEWLVMSLKHEYPYHFKWMGMPIIQFPSDIVLLQELVWQVKPDLIIETGVARGGSVVFYASLQQMMGLTHGKVVGIDIDIRAHNRALIEQHPMSAYIELLQGSSTAPEIIEQVSMMASGKEHVMVILDSLHTHDHVLRELELYSPLVTPGSYMVVLDTLIEDMPEGTYSDRPWAKGNNPKTAVHEFLASNSRFEIDSYWHEKALITVAHDGFLKCKHD